VLISKDPRGRAFTFCTSERLFPAQPRAESDSSPAEFYDLRTFPRQLQGFLPPFSRPRKRPYYASPCSCSRHFKGSPLEDCTPDLTLLFRLSAEIRNQIYELALHQNDPINVRRKSESRTRVPPPPLRLEHEVSHPMALTTTCRQIRAECVQLFYATNTFAINCGWSNCHGKKRQCERGDKALGDFLHQIGPSNTSALRAILFKTCSEAFTDPAIFENTFMNASTHAHLDPRLGIRCRVRFPLVSGPEYSSTILVSDFDTSMKMLVQDMRAHEDSADTSWGLLGCLSDFIDYKRKVHLLSSW